MGCHVKKGKGESAGEDGVLVRGAFLVDMELVERLAKQLDAHQAGNRRLREAYEGKRVARIAGVRVTQKLRNLAVRVGWPRTVVDVLEERLEFLGWEHADEFGLDDIYTTNGLGAEASLVHLDSLIYGVGFALVGVDEDGHVQVTAQSPFTTTGLWDGQKRRLMAGLRRVDHGLILYEPEATTFLADEAGKLHVVSVDEHGLGRVPLVMFPNRIRGSRSWGESEITPMVLDLSDEASRTLLDMAVHRTFHASPQRYVIANIDQDEFEQTGASWKALTEEVWGLNASPSDVKLGEFSGVQPLPFTTELQQLTELLAAEAGIPVSYLGITSSNPSSADAIRAGEARLVKRAERHQTAFGASWVEVARMALLARDGAIPEDFRRVYALWRDAATPTRAAAADEVSKLVGAGILPAGSSITMTRLGFTPAQQAVLRAEREADPGDMALLAAAIDRQASSASTAS